MRRISILLGLVTVLVGSAEAQIKGKEVITPQISYQIQIDQSEFPEWRFNLPEEQRLDLVETLLQKAKSGELQAYGLSPTQLPCTTEACRLEPEDLDSILNPVSFHYIRDPSSGERDVKSEVKSIKAKDIAMLDFIEEWQYDAKRDQFSKQVNGIGLMVRDYSAEGELRGYRVLFYVWLEEVAFEE